MKRKLPVRQEKNVPCDVCNKCDIYKCKYFIPFGCSSFKDLPNFKTSLFEAALFRNPQGVHDTLKNINMQVVDSNRKPYFNIIVKR